MMIKLPITQLLQSERLLIYGAGQVGREFLRRIKIFSFDAEGSSDKRSYFKDVTVWDKRFAEIGELYGWKVERPDFESAKDFDVAIIAIGSNDNQAIIDEIAGKLRDNGLDSIYSSSQVNFSVERINISEFENNGYSDCRYQSDIDFSKYEPRIKALAYYLPQFHEIPENNEWWGKGFTEWTNTRKAKPRFKGHYQPREPHDDLGYYDLSDVNVIRKQAELAKRHGIYGWCIYYYNFSGKTLLTKPIDLLLENSDIDIKFCLQWCNEDWSKQWVGNDKEVLMKCGYSIDDADKLVIDIKRYLFDNRYVRIDGKPLLVIYHAAAIPDCREFIDAIRKTARRVGVGELYILNTITPFSSKELQLEGVFDGDKTFSPATLYTEILNDMIDANSDVVGKFGKYKKVMDSYLKSTTELFESPYYSCMAGWDNSPRYKTNFKIYDIDFSLKDFYDTTVKAINESLEANKHFIFPFAWNEWAEGAYLEPDKRNGYAVINTLSKALCGLAY